MVTEKKKTGTGLEIETATRQGTRHSQNEDNHVSKPEHALFAVSDGMGGHRDGHLASRAFVEELQVIEFADGEGVNERLQRIEAAFHRVNDQLYGSYLENPDADISGCTGLTLIIHDGYAGCQWVGDSRLYLLRQGHLFLVSEDHSDDLGRLTRALGSHEEILVDRRVIEFLKGDCFVLCTDGLFKGASETTIADALADGSAGVADRLVTHAVEGGSSDDVTLITVRLNDNG
jgi:serine/threonine-protein phosphatase Stp1